MRREAVRHRGAVLIVVMLIAAVLASLSLVYSRSVRVEMRAVDNAAGAAQARAIAEAAAQVVMTLGSEAPVEAVEIGEGGAYWIIRPDPESDLTHDFGIVDEAAKLNLNAASEEMLLKLPEMNEDLAGVIIDWRDRDDQISSAGGSESEYYLVLADPYLAKNASLESLEELLLLRGYTALELYGEDANRNGVLDDNENDGDASSPPDDADGQLDRGLLAYVTVYSREPQQNPRGETFNVNDNNAHRGLEQFMAGLWGDDRADEVTDRIRDRRTHRNAIDLFFKSEMTLEEFVQVAHRLSYGGRGRRSLINVNTAPREVLMTLPGLTDADADALIAYRGGTDQTGAPSANGQTPPQTSANLDSVAWVTQVLDREKAIGIGSQITTVSYQYSADIVAVAPGGRAFERFRLVYDVSDGSPRVLVWQRLTHLGWPLDRTLLEALRSGTPVDRLPRSNDGRML
jgi:type II secretory pathway component PulK